MTGGEWLGSSNAEEMLLVLGRRTLSDRKLRLWACGCVRSVWELLEGNPDSCRAVEMAESFADGKATSLELMAGYEPAAQRWIRMDQPDEEGQAKGYQPWHAAVDASSCADSDAGDAAAHVAGMPRVPEAATILRCVSSNPFRPWARPTGKGNVNRIATPTIERLAAVHVLEWAWTPPLVAGLARAAYDERLPSGVLDPFRLALVADALEEAGCPAEITCPKCQGRGWLDVDVTVSTLGWGWCDCDEKHQVTNPLLTHLRSPGPHVRGCWAVDLVLDKE